MRFTKLLTGALAGGMALFGLPATTATAADAWNPAPPTMTMASWNLCIAGGKRGEDSFCPSRLTTTETAEKVDQIVALIRERNLDAVVLQEACGVPEGFVPTPGAPASDQKRLMTKLQNADGTTDWSFYFTPLTRGDDALDPVEDMGSHCQGDAYGKGGSGKVGNLIAVKGEISAADQINGVPVTTKDKLRLPVQCVAVEGKSIGVCNTHIIAKTYAEDSRVQGQIKNVRDFVQGFRARHQLQFIALGGVTSTVPSRRPQSYPTRTGSWSNSRS